MQQLIFLGDIHGNLELLKYFIKTLKIRNAYFIQVGDFGTHSIHKSAYSLLNEYLVETNNYLYAIRGNHDDSKSFKITTNIESNITLVADYNIINILGLNILCIGGAISIDRKYRLEYGLHYDFDEAIIQDLTLLDKIENVDICVTHSAPIFAFPTPYITDDKILESELRNERIYLEKVYNIIKDKGLKHWYYGHFHNEATEFIYNVEFNLVNMNKLKEHYF